MKWSWKIARVAGIDVFVHATFLILVLWIGLSYWMIGQTSEAVIEGVGFVLALFSCVVLHELGHALTARRYGIVTRKITLLPIGGVASMEKLPEDPKQEIAVALAGPAVNIVIAVIIWVWLKGSGAWVPLAEMSLAEGTFMQRLMLINILLGVFNLLPAFPMDGGRVLRAALALRMDHNRATQMAARIGQGLALWLGFFGLLYNPFLLFIALFVWIGAATESGMEQVKSTLSGMQAGRAMLTDFQILKPHDTLARAVELTLAGTQKEFPVVRDGVMVGVLSQTDLLKGLQSGGELSRVSEWMQEKVISADIHEPLEKVLERLQIEHSPLVSVTESDHQGNKTLVGIVNMENIMELINFQMALREHEGQSGLSA